TLIALASGNSLTRHGLADDTSQRLQKPAPWYCYRSRNRRGRNWAPVPLPGSGRNGHPGSLSRRLERLCPVLCARRRSRRGIHALVVARKADHRPNALTAITVVTELVSRAIRFQVRNQSTIMPLRIHSLNNEYFVVGRSRPYGNRCKCVRQIGNS